MLDLGKPARVVGFISLCVLAAAILGGCGTKGDARSGRGRRDQPIASARPMLPLTPIASDTPAQLLAVRPRFIAYTGDGSGVLVGVDGEDGTKRTSLGKASSGIRWTRWTDTLAEGRGDDRVDTCDRSCGGGPWLFYPVRIQLWRPEAIQRGELFTRMTIWFTGEPPRGEPQHYTFTGESGTDLFAKDANNLGRASAFQWGPPGIGYCVIRPPATGCNSIHELPTQSTTPSRP
jgi:hypothetical protein